LLWSEFFTNRDWPLASTLAVCIIMALFLPMFIFKKLQTLRRQAS
jgi:putrescine transport system permease protein